MKLAVALAFLAILTGCATPAVLEPAPGTYPCGPFGVSCPGHMCCAEGETCTADGACEFVAPNPEMSRRAPHRQRPEK